MQKRPSAIPIGSASDHRRHQPTLAVDRGQFIADVDALQSGHDFLGHLHDLIPEKLAAHPVALDRPQKLYKDAPLRVVGVDSIVDRTEPKGPPRHREIEVGGDRFARAHIVGCHRGREERVIDDVHRGHPRAGHLHHGGFEAVFRPIHLFHRFERRGGDHVLPAIGLAGGPLHPHDIDHARLGGKHLLRVGTVVESTRARILRCGQIPGTQFICRQRPAIGGVGRGRHLRSEQKGRLAHHQRIHHPHILELYPFPRPRRAIPILREAFRVEQRRRPGHRAAAARQQFRRPHRRRRYDDLRSIVRPLTNDKPARQVVAGKIRRIIQRHPGARGS